MRKRMPRWWDHVRKMIRDYPDLRDRLIDLQQQTVTSSLSGMPSGGGANRSTELAALRKLPDPDDQASYEAVDKAVKLTALKRNGQERLNLIRLVYWNRCPNTLSAAADKLYIAEITAKRWHAEFIRDVAGCRGWLPKER